MDINEESRANGRNGWNNSEILENVYQYILRKAKPPSPFSSSRWTFTSSCFTFAGQRSRYLFYIETYGYTCSRFRISDFAPNFPRITFPRDSRHKRRTRENKLRKIPDEVCPKKLKFTSASCAVMKEKIGTLKFGQHGCTLQVAPRASRNRGGYERASG